MAEIIVLDDKGNPYSYLCCEEVEPCELDNRLQNIVNTVLSDGLDIEQTRIIVKNSHGVQKLSSRQVWWVEVRGKVRSFFLSLRVTR